MSSRLVRGDIESIVAPVVWTITRRNIESADSAPVTLPDPLAEQALEARINDARQRGFREGRTEALREHQAQVQPLADRLEEIVADFAGTQDTARKEKEEQLVELAIAVSRRILHREVTVDPQAVQALVKAAMDRIESRDVRRIRTHPMHRDFVRSVLERGCPEKSIEIIADEKLRPGALLFETEHGDLDASVDSQLEEIRRGLADRI